MARSGEQGLDQRLDRWVEAGRQFVDGVSGARPGSRGAARGPARRGSSRLNPGELGRWVENKLEWLLDDEGADDWREPWQQPPAAAQPAQARSRRRPLEAISRRGQRRSDVIQPQPPAPAAAPEAGDAWPDDDAFSVPRWQRQQRQERRSGVDPTGAGPTDLSRERNSGERPLPRSSRRR